MISNFFKTGLRAFAKQKGHALINIGGLSLGLSATMIIALFITTEQSFDNFHTKKERIALLPMTWHFGDTDLSVGQNCGAGGPFMKESFAQVETYVRLCPVKRSFLKGTEYLVEDKLQFVDSTFFDVFTFPMLAGNAKTSLIKPQSIVITESFARRYFSSVKSYDGLLGQFIEGENYKRYEITGVLIDPPGNSHIQFSALLPLHSLSPSIWEPSWNNSNLVTYILFNTEDYERESIVQETDQKLLDKYGKDFTGVSLDLIALNDVYLNNPKYPLPNTSRMSTITTFTFIAVMILIIAVVNYINLSTSRAVERAKEVGVRKVMGAWRTQLIFQFLTESLFTVSLSVFLALALTVMAIPFFNSLMQSNISMTPLYSVGGLSFLVISLILVSVMAGCYPAYVISAYNPIRVLKGKLRDSRGYIRLRETLVVFQFVISISLIIVTVVLMRQVEFMKSKDLGFSKNQLVAISMDSLTRTRLEPLRNALSQKTFVQNSSLVSQLPVQITFESAINPGLTQVEESRSLVRVLGTDANFIETSGVELLSGTGFSTNMNEGTEVVLNESAAAFFGWSNEQAIGQSLFIWTSPKKVKGVIKDFHFSSLKEEIKPLAVFHQPNLRYLMVLTKTDDPALLAKEISDVWKNINPETSFQMQFLSDRYETLYQSETRLGILTSIFSFLSIVVATLGLFGLCAYLIRQRTKEIGIRKVLGATFVRLFTMVSVQFLRPVLVAFLVSIPVSYYLATDWLTDFSYRMEFSWPMVLIVGLAAMIISVVTIVFHSYHIASTNPASTLKED